MVYEKKKVSEAVGVPPADCGFCQRPKTTVYCGDCMHRMVNVRARKACVEHPRELFLMDLVKCPNCKGGDLREHGLDTIPQPIVQPIHAPEYMEQYTIEHFEQAAEMERGREEPLLVAVPAPVAPPSTQNPGANREIDCLCRSPTNSYILCTCCGYYARGVRKTTRCPVHVVNRDGIRECPECGAGSDSLMDEQDV